MGIPTSELNFLHSVDYHYGQFPPNNIDYKRLVNPLGDAVNAIARFDQMLTTLHNSDILLAPLRNQEAVISSRMEGTISTMDEILQYEADYDDGDLTNKNVRSEIIETLLYQRALRGAESAINSGAKLSEHMIRSLHQMLLSFGRGADKSPGKYKTEQNYLVDRTKRNVLFVPIKPETLLDSMQGLMEFVEKNEDQILIKTALAHVEFEALHPFKDGNGRVGRMLITLMLWEAKVISAPHFYISGYLEERKDDYIHLMRQVSKNNQWTSWCKFFLEAITAQAKRNLEVATKISDLYEEMKPIFSDVLSSRYSINALDFIFANPVFRNSKFTTNSGIPSHSAAKFSPLLANRGILDVVIPASGRRPAMYRFEPMMKLVRV